MFSANKWSNFVVAVLYLYWFTVYNYEMFELPRGTFFIRIFLHIVTQSLVAYFPCLGSTCTVNWDRQFSKILFCFCDFNIEWYVCVFALDVISKLVCVIHECYIYIYIYWFIHGTKKKMQEDYWGVYF